ncbi:hypothetical protein GYMLUDRAFT_258936 [Collybiopsis luxurians FD-317 M1]|nr:hypothetical protein GYMLUDRAFT_258936 [Collybiopsis luxurians FD-317 M1]
MMDRQMSRSSPVPLLITLPNLSFTFYQTLDARDMSSSNPVNYAELFGFKSIAAAAIYDVAYIPLSIWFIPMLFRHRLIELWESLESETQIRNPLNDVLRNRKLFHLALAAGMIMGIVGDTLREVSVIIFVILTILQVYQTLTLVIAENKEDPDHRVKRLGNTIGAQHGAIIFALVALLLLVREIYMLATISSAVKQNREATWDPLVAMPELLCIALYALPGVIPPPFSSYPDLLPR